VFDGKISGSFQGGEEFIRFVDALLARQNPFMALVDAEEIDSFCAGTKSALLMSITLSLLGASHGSLTVS
jgi:hypothetical protein